jgi:hypothetical protein
MSQETRAVESQVPTRMDRLPFSRWHLLVIAALGITWILDGLEVTMVGNVAAVLTDPDSGLGLSEGQVELARGIIIERERRPCFSPVSRDSHETLCSVARTL